MVEIHLVGIGATKLPAGLGMPPPIGFIMAGLAGALDPSLRIGDVVIDDCPGEFLPHAQCRAGKIVTSKTIVATPSEKRLLFEKTGALAVDMESAVVRAVAAKLNVPFVSIRAISDAAGESLDPAVLRMVDKFGNPRLIDLAFAIIGKPALIPRLVRLGRSSNVAAKNLAAAVFSIVRQWSEIEPAPTD